MHNIKKSDILKVSGGNDDGFYQDVIKPMIGAAGVAAFYGGGAGLLAAPGMGIVIYGAEKFIPLVPELGPALEDIHHLNEFQIQDRLNHSYNYPD